MKIVDLALLLWVVVGLHMAINVINAEQVVNEKKLKSPNIGQ